MNIGQEIKSRRLALRLTQRQVAERVGHNKSYVSDIERNRRDISIKTLQPYINALGGRLNLEWSVLSDINS